MFIVRWILIATIFFIYLFIMIDWSNYINRINLFKTESTDDGKNITTFRRKQPQFPLNCFNGNMTYTCPKDYYPTKLEQVQDASAAASTCPDYFKWIHEDLRPWKRTGITRQMVERGKNVSCLRVVIKQGKAYVEKYANSFQTRDVFTVWGILQLLRLYPGKIPDLELLFETGDKTVVDKQHFQGPPPPPIFHYCGQKDAYDIVFPDWSFWGWAELAIKPWEALLQDIDEGNKKMKWKDRLPYAFWKGNTEVSYQRYYLTKCNASDQQDSHVHIYPVHWDKEFKQQFKNTKLEDQCAHRYKIYVEGVAWSVSEKYILACDSMTLFIEPIYYDFFTRSLEPGHHYWPISRNRQNVCNDIKYAVEWGNANPHQAEAIGKAGTRFIEENLKMKFVYDYMFHLLSEYARLLRFEPTISEGAIEICSENLACTKSGIWREYMVESMVNSPSDTHPCTMVSPLMKKIRMRKNKVAKDDNLDKHGKYFINFLLYK